MTCSNDLSLHSLSCLSLSSKAVFSSWSVLPLLQPLSLLLYRLVFAFLLPPGIFIHKMVSLPHFFFFPCFNSPTPITLIRGFPHISQQILFYFPFLTPFSWPYPLLLILVFPIICVFTSPFSPWFHFCCHKDKWMLVSSHQLQKWKLLICTENLSKIILLTNSAFVLHPCHRILKSKKTYEIPFNCLI